MALLLIVGINGIIRLIKRPDIYNAGCEQMHKAKKFLLIFAVAVFSSFVVAHADSPAPPNYFYIYINNAGPTVKYADLLIKINKSSKSFTDFNSYADVYAFNSSTPIVAYNQDGYMSISFHCKNVQANLNISQASGDIELSNGYKPISTITNSIKIALLDKNGNILKVSKAVSVAQAGKDTFPRQVRYDARGAAPTVIYAPYSYRSGTPPNLFGLILRSFLIRMVISTAIETLIAIPYKLRPLWNIIAVNVATQILLFAFTTFSGLSYTAAVIVGELFVYIAEFAVYLFLFKAVSKPKLAFYTVLANTASLAVGLIFNYFHVLVI